VVSLTDSYGHILGVLDRTVSRKNVINFFFAICTNTFSKLCKRRIQFFVEECSVAFIC
jgi:hypothetical protein